MTLGDSKVRKWGAIVRQMVPKGSQKIAKGNQKGAKATQKEAKRQPKCTQRSMFGKGRENPPTLGRAWQTTYWGEVYLPPYPPPPGPLAAVAEACLHVSANVQAHVCTSGPNGPKR